MIQHFYMGVDGGATKTTIRLEDHNGKLLGTETSGPANIRLSCEQAWQSIHTAFAKLCQQTGLTLDKAHQVHVGMGLAGCEMQAAYQAFLNKTHAFQTLVVSSDSHTACLGAHQGKDGAIIIAGTGTVGFQFEGNKQTKVGGWGFPHDDEGGGAWLGFQAVKTTLQWLDGRLPASALARSVYDYFANDMQAFIRWADTATSTQFAQLAPLVIEEAKASDSAAIHLLQEAGVALSRIDAALLAAQQNTTTPLPCSLVGSITPFLEPYLATSLRSRLRPSLGTPEAGAILLVKASLFQGKDTEK